MVPNLQAATPKHFFDLYQVIKYMFPHVTPLNLIRLNTICTSHSLFPPCMTQVFKWLIVLFQILNYRMQILCTINKIKACSFFHVDIILRVNW